jgi:hypothetical protein
MRCIPDALLIVFRVEVDFAAEADLPLDVGLGVEVGFLVLVVFGLLVSMCLVGVGLTFVPDFIVSRAENLCMEVILLALVADLFTEVVHVVEPGLAIDGDLLIEDFDTLGIGGRGAKPTLLELC